MSTEFLKSSSVSLPNGSSIVTLTGSIDASFVSTGTAVFINGVIYEGISGTLYDGSGDSTITLRNVYTGTSVVAGTLTAFNTIEGLRDAIRRARDITDDASQIQTTFGIVLTSTNATETIVINGVDTVVTPYGYLTTQMNAGVLLAEQWANQDEDVVVESGEYSAKHYSLKAAQSVADVTSIRHTKLANAMFRGFMANKLQETSAPTDTKADINWIRAGGKTYRDRYGTVKYSPSPDATNLITYSEDLSHANWNKNGTVSIVSDVAISPFGTITADRVIISTGGHSENVNQLATVTDSGQRFTSSYFVKNETIGKVRLRMVLSGGTAIDRGFDYDVDSKTVSGLASGAIAEVEDAGDGWLRLSLTLVGNGTNTTSQMNISGSSTGETGTFLAVGAQLEESRVANGYQKTTTVAVTGTSYVGITQATEESEGWLIEGASTNLLLHSEDLNNGVWGGADYTITTASVAAPDGTLTAQKLVAANGLVGFITQSLTVVSGAEHTYSIYAKKAETDSFLMYFDTGVAGIVYASFNLTTGVAVVVSGTGLEVSMEATGDGWYKCRSIATSDSTVWNPQYLRSNGNGDGVSGFYVWGHQFEALPFASSYIPTTSASVTRSTDIVTVTPTGNLPNTLNDLTFSYEYSLLGRKTGSTEIQMALYSDAFSSFVQNGYISAGAARSSTQLMTSNDRLIRTPSDSEHNIIAMGVDSQTLYVDGTSVATDTVVSVSTALTDLTIGGHTTADRELYGHLKNLEIHDFAFNAAEAKMRGTI